MSIQVEIGLIILTVIISATGCGRSQAVNNPQMHGLIVDNTAVSRDDVTAKIDRVKLAAIEFGAQALRMSVEEFMTQFAVFEEEEGSGTFKFFSRDSEFLKGENLETFDPSTILILGGFPDYFVVTIDSESLKVNNCILSRK